MLAEMIGATRPRVSFFMNKFDANGGARESVRVPEAEPKTLAA
jgi:hypothetical protein